ncbi:MAG: M56 family metallopeptidase [Defluviitaleaceae bacterium]|nr:M56 family metallopeptidase [Defluviitaleaceae bacterium]MCL2274749.1 M56 family metallopeptidase [Defluviitaleaceae bacterium]
MQGLFIALLICSATMSLLAMAYWGVQTFLSRRYFIKGWYYAWLVIILGLIIPIRPHFDHAIFHFPLSNIAMLQGASSSFDGGGVTVGNMHPADWTATAVTADAALARAIPWLNVAIGIWLVGATAFLLLHFKRHFQFTMMVKRWGELIEDEETLLTFHVLKEKMGIKRKIELLHCESINTPMLYGLFNPKILLPDEKIPIDALTLILTHELVHYKRKDLLYKCLIMVATAMHWFNPLVYIIARAINEQCEISCDAEVIINTNADTRQKYTETIINVIKYHTETKIALSTHFYEGGLQEVKKRITHILDMRPYRKRNVPVVIGVLLLCMLGMGALVNTQAQGIYVQQPTQTNREAQALPHIYTLEDLKKPLHTLGLSFMQIASYPPTRNTLCLRTIHIGRVSSETPIRIYTIEDVDVLFTLAYLIIANELNGFSWDTCVDYAMRLSGMYDYWRAGFRELTRPMRDAQLIELAARYSFDELYTKIFRHRPCVLLEFHELGLLLEISVDDVVLANRR